jgi:hypothetical protein
MGVGVTTLVTIMVVLLLTVFAVLTLASARSDEHLSQMAANAVSDYYAADGEATTWYATLAEAAKGKDTEANVLALATEGYTVTRASNGGLIVKNSFAMGVNRQLMVTVQIDGNGGCTITQWQTSAKEQ